MSFSIRRAAITSVSFALIAALTPLACSSKTPEAEPTIVGCTSDTQCMDGYCDTNGLCQPRCSATNACPMGQSCGADGRCSTSSSGGTGGTGTGGASGGGGTAGVLPVMEAGPDGDGSLADAACATGTAEARFEPVSMFVMFDRSG
jgi:hypothetical protein